VGIGLPVRRTKPRPRILYLVPAWPHERSFGQQLRVLHVGRALQNIGEVKLAVVSITEDAEAMEKTANEFQVHCNLRMKQLIRRGPGQRLKWWLDPTIQDSCGFFVEERARVRLCQSLGDFDLIWLNCVRVANMFGLWRWPRSMLDIDDLPSTYQLTEFRHGDRLMDRFKAGARMLALRRREKLLAERFTLLGVCSEEDRRSLGGGSHIHVIPNGFQRPAVEPQPQPTKPPRLGFIGVFTHPPNLEGVRWFMRKCWPQIKRDVPDVRLRLIGKHTDGPLKPADPDVDGLGFVADPSEEIASWSAMIVPLQLGSGTRLKVAEALSRKCPLISTRFGALGYDLADDKEAFLADAPEAFAEACIRVIRAPSEAATVADRAWRRFLNNWTWDAIAPRVWSAAEGCLRLR
jgi:glycosyltransferase involved in cell wall biosynthesis